MLGNSKYSVLIIDKKKILGPKICAGGLTVHDYEFISAINTKIKYEIQHVMLNGKENVIDLKNPLYTIDRKDLGQYQENLIKKYPNIILMKNTEAIEIHEKYIKTRSDNSEKNIFYKYLVGADGSASIVRKYLGFPSRLYMGIQYIIPRKHDKLVWFLNPKIIGSGYGWIFPHQEFTSAGLFYDPKKINAALAKEKLDKILNDYGMDFSGSKFEGAPTNCLFKGFKFGNIFLSGDAAGLVSANTGEGISYALISGADVARHLLDSRYDFNKIRDILKYKKRQERILKIFNIAYYSWIQTIMFKIFLKLLNKQWFQNYYGD